MAFSVQMPALGESVTEGTVTRWLKREGDQVAADEPLLEVSTDKVDTEIPSPAAGVLSRIVVSEDETVDVGAELAVIDDAGDGAEPAAGAEPEAPAQAEPAAQPEAEQAGQAGQPEQAEQPAAPAEPERWERPAATAPAEPPTESPAAPAAGPGDAGEGSPVTMPVLGESVTEGTVTRWLKQVGDHVEVDEPLLEVSTDKVDTEIPSPLTGTLLEISVGEDQTVEVGGTLAMISTGAPAQDAEPESAAQPTQPAQAPAGAPPSQAAPLPQPADASPATEDTWREPARPAAPPQPAPAPAQATDGQAAVPYVTPLVRKLAAEHGIDLGGVRGTGVGGRIRKQDVLAAAEAARQPAPEPEPAPAATEPAGAAAPAAVTPEAAELRGSTRKMSRLRQLIARRMVESLQTSAQLTTVVEIDITRIARLRERAKRTFEAREGVKLSYLPFFAKATVEALKQHPKVNASIDSETLEVTYHGTEHLAVAVDTERGLVVPVIKDAGDLNIAGLARRIADLAQRTRANKITPDDISGGTFTLTNTGSRGALFDTPIINQPQVGILGTGAVVKRPVVVSDDAGDTIAIRSMCYLALSYDHRLVDGADAARFLAGVKERLEEGAFEADLGL